MLIRSERTLLVTYCHDHAVAVCPRCGDALTWSRIGADIVMGTRDFCPACRADLTDVLRRHLATCTVLRVQARETHDRAQQIGVEPSAPSNGAAGAVSAPPRSRDGRRVTGPGLGPDGEEPDAQSSSG
jgi:hypothetical protein